MPTARLSLGVIVFALGAACASTTRQAQILHLDASDPSKSLRCDVTPDGEKNCKPWNGRAISPGTLAIDVQNRQLDTGYDVKVAQSTREASPEDVKAVLDEVASRLISGIRATLARGVPDGRIAAALDVAADAAPQATAALRDKLTTATPPATVDRATVLGRYIDKPAGGTASLLAPAAANAKFGADALYSGPAVPPAPPRTYRLTADDLTWLGTEGFTLPVVQAWIGAWCQPASFASAAQTSAYAALANESTPEELIKAIDLSPEALLEIWRGRSPSAPLDTRLAALIAEGNGPWAAASPAAQTFLLMRLGTGLALQLATCKANLELVQATVPTTLPPLLADAKRHAEAFSAVLGGYLRGGLRTIERDAVADADGHFGVFDLPPGRIEIEAGATHAQTRTTLGSFKADVLGMERFAIVVGPMITGCANAWGCFDTFADYVDTRGRFIVRNRSQYDVAIATALHVTLYAWDRYAIGALVGYPLGTPDSTTYNLLGGVGLRTRNGVELAVGLHAFRAPTVRPGYGPTPIALFENGHEDLTVSAVTEDHWRAGVFVMLGLDPSLFSKLK